MMIRNLKITSWLAWLWFGIMLIVSFATLPDSLGSSTLQGSLLKTINAVIGLFIQLAFPLVGALIISHQPKNTIGWLFMLPALAVLLDPFIRTQITGVTIPPSHPSILFWIAAYLSNTYWLFGIFPIFFIALLFPTGRPLSPRWRWAVFYALGMFLFFFIFAVFDKTIAPDSSNYGVNWSIPNPLGFLDTSTIDNLFTIWIVGMAVLALLCVASIVMRYRHAGVVERKQIKWLLYALSFFVVCYAISLPLQSWGQEVWSLSASLFLLAIPLAIGIAILRYQLFDIDLIIRKTLQYALLTGLLVLVYFSSVVLLQNLVETLTGQQSPVVIVVSTLAIAALFNPLRIRVQNFIDRRFFRNKYNAEQALIRFAMVARDEVDLDNLMVTLLGAVEETLQPERVSLWLKPSRKIFISRDLPD